MTQSVTQSTVEASRTSGPKDLREFLRRVEDDPTQGIVRVTREVSVMHELSAVVKVLELERGNPLVMFENVADTDLRVVASVHGTKERIALALGQPVDKCVEWFMKILEQPIPPTEVESGPPGRVPGGEPGTDNAAPHCAQNLLSGEFSVPHAVQNTLETPFLQCAKPAMGLRSRVFMQICEPSAASLV